MKYDSNPMSTNKTEELDRWNIIKSYFDKQHLQRLVRHQIESYNDFVNYQIQLLSIYFLGYENFHCS